MARTTDSAVAEVLGNDYDGCASLRPRIASANLLVSRVATCATAKGQTLSAAELEMLERILAAHFYTKTDPVYASKSTNGASASFVRGNKEPEPYKDWAISMDPSGCLNALMNRQTADIFWGGKTEPEQLDYRERN